MPEQSELLADINCSFLLYHPRNAASSNISLKGSGLSLFPQCPIPLSTLEYTAQLLLSSLQMDLEKTDLENLVRSESTFPDLAILRPQVDKESDTTDFYGQLDILGGEKRQELEPERIELEPEDPFIPSNPEDAVLTVSFITPGLFRDSLIAKSIIPMGKVPLNELTLLSIPLISDSSQSASTEKSPVVMDILLFRSSIQSQDEATYISAAAASPEPLTQACLLANWLDISMLLRRTPFISPLAIISSISLLSTTLVTLRAMITDAKAKASYTSLRRANDEYIRLQKEYNILVPSLLRVAEIRGISISFFLRNATDKGQKIVHNHQVNGSNTVYNQAAKTDVGEILEESAAYVCLTEKVQTLLAQPLGAKELTEALSSIAYAMGRLQEGKQRWTASDDSEFDSNISKLQKLCFLWQTPVSWVPLAVNLAISDLFLPFEWLGRIFRNLHLIPSALHCDQALMIATTRSMLLSLHSSFSSLNNRHLTGDLIPSTAPLKKLPMDLCPSLCAVRAVLLNAMRAGPSGSYPNSTWEEALLPFVHSLSEVDLYGRTVMSCLSSPVTLAYLRSVLESHGVYILQERTEKSPIKPQEKGKLKKTWSDFPSYSEMTSTLWVSGFLPGREKEILAVFRTALEFRRILLSTVWIPSSSSLFPKSDGHGGVLLVFDSSISALYGLFALPDLLRERKSYGTKTIPLLAEGGPLFFAFGPARLSTVHDLLESEIASSVVHNTKIVHDMKTNTCVDIDVTMDANRDPNIQSKDEIICNLISAYPSLKLSQSLWFTTDNIPLQQALLICREMNKICVQPVSQPTSSEKKTYTLETITLYSHSSTKQMDVLKTKDTPPNVVPDIPYLSFPQRLEDQQRICSFFRMTAEGAVSHARSVLDAVHTSIISLGLALETLREQHASEIRLKTAHEYHAVPSEPLSPSSHRGRNSKELNVQPMNTWNNEGISASKRNIDDANEVLKTKKNRGKKYQKDQIVEQEKRKKQYTTPMLSNNQPDYNEVDDEHEKETMLTDQYSMKMPVDIKTTTEGRAFQDKILALSPLESSSATLVSSSIPSSGPNSSPIFAPLSFTKRDKRSLSSLFVLSYSEFTSRILALQYRPGFFPSSKIADAVEILLKEGEHENSREGAKSRGEGVNDSKSEKSGIESGENIENDTKRLESTDTSIVTSSGPSTLNNANVCQALSQCNEDCFHVQSSISWTPTHVNMISKPVSVNVKLNSEENIRSPLQLSIEFTTFLASTTTPPPEIASLVAPSRNYVASEALDPSLFEPACYFVMCSSGEYTSDVSSSGSIYLFVDEIREIVKICRLPSPPISAFSPFSSFPSFFDDLSRLSILFASTWEASISVSQCQQVQSFSTSSFSELSSLIPEAHFALRRYNSLLQEITVTHKDLMVLIQEREKLHQSVAIPSFSATLPLSPVSSAVSALTQVATFDALPLDIVHFLSVLAWAQHVFLESSQESVTSATSNIEAAFKAMSWLQIIADQTLTPSQKRSLASSSLSVTHCPLLRKYGKLLANGMIREEKGQESYSCAVCHQFFPYSSLIWLDEPHLTTPAATHTLSTGQVCLICGPLLLQRLAMEESHPGSSFTLEETLSACSFSPAFTTISNLSSPKSKSSLPGAIWLPPMLRLPNLRQAVFESLSSSRFAIFRKYLIPRLVRTPGLVRLLTSSVDTEACVMAVLARITLTQPFSEYSAMPLSLPLLSSESLSSVSATTTVIVAGEENSLIEKPNLVVDTMKAKNLSHSSLLTFDTGMLKMLTCPSCRAVFEFSSPPQSAVFSPILSLQESMLRNIRGSVKGIQGELLTSTQLHYWRYSRASCPSCCMDCCGDCLTSPFHTGLTCTEAALARDLMVPRCRFCGGICPESTAERGFAVCNTLACQTHVKYACCRRLSCNHVCGGALCEKYSLPCPPCLLCPPENHYPAYEDPFADSEDEDVGTEVEKEPYIAEICSICQTDPLSCAPVISFLDCGHTVHYSCAYKRIRRGTGQKRVGYDTKPLHSQRKKVAGDIDFIPEPDAAMVGFHDFFDDAKEQKMGDFLDNASKNNPGSPYHKSKRDEEEFEDNESRSTDTSCVECPLCRRVARHPALNDVSRLIHLCRVETAKLAFRTVLVEDILPIEAKKWLRFRFRKKPKQQLLFESGNDTLSLSTAVNSGSTKLATNMNTLRDPITAALSRFIFSPCFECNKVFFRGARNCNLDDASPDPESVICAGCAAKATFANGEVIAGVHNGPDRLRQVGQDEQTTSFGFSESNFGCPVHGLEHILYKCSFCCKGAIWFCFGQYHFCNDCHVNIRQKFSNSVKRTVYPVSHYTHCPGLDDQVAMLEKNWPSFKGNVQAFLAKMGTLRSHPELCPSGVSHPPALLPFSFGCSMCSLEEAQREAMKLNAKNKEAKDRADRKVRKLRERVMRAAKKRLRGKAPEKIHMIDEFSSEDDLNHVSELDEGSDADEEEENEDEEDEDEDGEKSYVGLVSAEQRAFFLLKDGLCFPRIGKNTKEKGVKSRTVREVELFSRQKQTSADLFLSSVGSVWAHHPLPAFVPVYRFILSHTGRRLPPEFLPSPPQPPLHLSSTISSRDEIRPWGAAFILISLDDDGFTFPFSGLDTIPNILQHGKNTSDDMSVTTSLHHVSLQALLKDLNVSTDSLLSIFLSCKERDNQMEKDTRGTENGKNHLPRSCCVVFDSGQVIILGRDSYARPMLTVQELGFQWTHGLLDVSIRNEAEQSMQCRFLSLGEPMDTSVLPPSTRPGLSRLHDKNKDKDNDNDKGKGKDKSMKSSTEKVAQISLPFDIIPTAFHLGLLFSSEPILAEKDEKCITNEEYHISPPLATPPEICIRAIPPQDPFWAYHESHTTFSPFSPSSLSTSTLGESLSYTQDSLPKPYISGRLVKPCSTSTSLFPSTSTSALTSTLSSSSIISSTSSLNIFSKVLTIASTLSHSNHASALHHYLLHSLSTLSSASSIRLSSLQSITCMRMPSSLARAVLLRRFTLSISTFSNSKKLPFATIARAFTDKANLPKPKMAEKQAALSDVFAHQSGSAPLELPIFSPRWPALHSKTPSGSGSGFGGSVRSLPQPVSSLLQNLGSYVEVTLFLPQSHGPTQSFSVDFGFSFVKPVEFAFSRLPLSFSSLDIIDMGISKNDHITTPLPCSFSDLGLASGLGLKKSPLLPPISFIPPSNLSWRVLVTNSSFYDINRKENNVNLPPPDLSMEYSNTLLDYGLDPASLVSDVVLLAKADPSTPLSNAGVVGHDIERLREEKEYVQNATEHALRIWRQNDRRARTGMHQFLYDKRKVQKVDEDVAEDTYPRQTIFSRNGSPPVPVFHQKVVVGFGASADGTRAFITLNGILSREIFLQTTPVDESKPTSDSQECSTLWKNINEKETIISPAAIFSPPTGRFYVSFEALKLIRTRMEQTLASLRSRGKTHLHPRDLFPVSLGRAFSRSKQPGSTFSISESSSEEDEFEALAPSPELPAVDEFAQSLSASFTQRLGRQLQRKRMREEEDKKLRNGRKAAHRALSQSGFIPDALASRTFQEKLGFPSSLPLPLSSDITVLKTLRTKDPIVFPVLGVYGDGVVVRVSGSLLSGRVASDKVLLRALTGISPTDQEQEQMKTNIHMSPTTNVEAEHLTITRLLRLADDVESCRGIAAAALSRSIRRHFPDETSIKSESYVRHDGNLSSAFAVKTPHPVVPIESLFQCSASYAGYRKNQEGDIVVDKSASEGVKNEGKRTEICVRGGIPFHLIPSYLNTSKDIVNTHKDVVNTDTTLFSPGILLTPRLRRALTSLPAHMLPSFSFEHDRDDFILTSSSTTSSSSPSSSVSPVSSSSTVNSSLSPVSSVFSLPSRVSASKMCGNGPGVASAPFVANTGNTTLTNVVIKSVMTSPPHVFSSHEIHPSIRRLLRGAYRRLVSISHKDYARTGLNDRLLLPTTSFPAFLAHPFIQGLLSSIPIATIYGGSPGHPHYHGHGQGHMPIPLSAWIVRAEHSLRSSLLSPGFAALTSALPLASSPSSFSFASCTVSPLVYGAWNVALSTLPLLAFSDPIPEITINPPEDEEMRCLRRDLAVEKNSPTPSRPVDYDARQVRIRALQRKIEEKIYYHKAALSQLKTIFGASGREERAKAIAEMTKNSDSSFWSLLPGEKGNVEMTSLTESSSSSSAFSMVRNALVLAHASSEAMLNQTQSSLLPQLQYQVDKDSTLPCTPSSVVNTTTTMLNALSLVEELRRDLVIARSRYELINSHTIQTVENSSSGSSDDEVPLADLSSSSDSFTSASDLSALESSEASLGSGSDLDVAQTRGSVRRPLSLITREKNQKRARIIARESGNGKSRRLRTSFRRTAFTRYRDGLSFQDILPLALELCFLTQHSPVDASSDLSTKMECIFSPPYRTSTSSTSPSVMSVSTSIASSEVTHTVSPILQYVQRILDWEWQTFFQTSGRESNTKTEPERMLSYPYTSLSSRSTYAEAKSMVSSCFELLHRTAPHALHHELKSPTSSSSTWASLLRVPLEQREKMYSLLSQTPIVSDSILHELSLLINCVNRANERFTLFSPSFDTTTPKIDISLIRQSNSGWDKVSPVEGNNIIPLYLRIRDVKEELLQKSYVEPTSWFLSALSSTSSSILRSGIEIDHLLQRDISLSPSMSPSSFVDEVKKAREDLQRVLLHAVHHGDSPALAWLLLAFHHALQAASVVRGIIPPLSRPRFPASFSPSSTSSNFPSCPGCELAISDTTPSHLAFLNAWKTALPSPPPRVLVSFPYITSIFITHPCRDPRPLKSPDNISAPPIHSSVAFHPARLKRGFLFVQPLGSTNRALETPILPFPSLAVIRKYLRGSAVFEVSPLTTIAQSPLISGPLNPDTFQRASALPQALVAGRITHSSAALTLGYTSLEDIADDVLTLSLSPANITGRPHDKQSGKKLKAIEEPHTHSTEEDKKRVLISIEPEKMHRSVELTLWQVEAMFKKRLTRLVLDCDPHLNANKHVSSWSGHILVTLPIAFPKNMIGTGLNLLLTKSILSFPAPPGAPIPLKNEEKEKSDTSVFGFYLPFSSSSTPSSPSAPVLSSPVYPVRCWNALRLGVDGIGSKAREFTPRTPFLMPPSSTLPGKPVHQDSSRPVKILPANYLVTVPLNPALTLASILRLGATFPPSTNPLLVPSKGKTNPKSFVSSPHTTSTTPTTPTPSSVPTAREQSVEHLLGTLISAYETSLAVASSPLRYLALDRMVDSDVRNFYVTESAKREAMSKSALSSTISSTLQSLPVFSLASVLLLRDYLEVDPGDLSETDYMNFISLCLLRTPTSAYVSLPPRKSTLNQNSTVSRTTKREKELLSPNIIHKALRSSPYSVSFPTPFMELCGPRKKKDNNEIIDTTFAKTSTLTPLRLSTLSTSLSSTPSMVNLDWTGERVSVESENPVAVVASDYYAMLIKGDFDPVFRQAKKTMRCHRGEWTCFRNTFFTSNSTVDEPILSVKTSQEFTQSMKILQKVKKKLEKQLDIVSREWREGDREIALVTKPVSYRSASSAPSALETPGDSTPLVSFDSIASENPGTVKMIDKKHLVTKALEISTRQRNFLSSTFPILSTFPTSSSSNRVVRISITVPRSIPLFRGSSITFPSLTSSSSSHTRLKQQTAFAKTVEFKPSSPYSVFDSTSQKLTGAILLRFRMSNDSSENYHCSNSQTDVEWMGLTGSISMKQNPKELTNKMKYSKTNFPTSCSFKRDGESKEKDTGIQRVIHPLSLVWREKSSSSKNKTNISREGWQETSTQDAFKQCSVVVTTDCWHSLLIVFSGVDATDEDLRQELTNAVQQSGNENNSGDVESLSRFSSPFTPTVSTSVRNVIISAKKQSSSLVSRRSMGIAQHLRTLSGNIHDNDAIHTNNIVPRMASHAGTVHPLPRFLRSGIYLDGIRDPVASEGLSHMISVVETSAGVVLGINLLGQSCSRVSLDRTLLSVPLVSVEDKIAANAEFIRGEEGKKVSRWAIKQLRNEKEKELEKQKEGENHAMMCVKRLAKQVEITNVYVQDMLMVSSSEQLASGMFAPFFAKKLKF